MYSSRTGLQRKRRSLDLREADEPAVKTRPQELTPSNCPLISQVEVVKQETVEEPMVRMKLKRLRKRH